MGWFAPISVLMCCLCSISVGFGQASLLVNIRNGTLEGSIMTSRKGREFEAFRGIPYAQPPTGDLRFEPPVPFGSWPGVRSAKEDSNFCIQRNNAAVDDAFIGDEDCLYLNVYRPRSQPMKRHSKKHPVMVWIHGGSFVEGSAHSGFYGPQFLMEHDIVLVTVNYRLGTLGLLSTEDLVSPGNQLLKDQAQAIRWVHENIAAFNGDPNSVTLFGESSGATSVFYHMMSPHVRGLFHRAITESGDAMEPLAIARPGVARNQSVKVGESLNCSTDTSAALISCLKTKSAVDIIATACRTQIFDKCPILPVRPVIEPDHPGAYITEEPEQSLKSGKVANIPWMTGINSQEGAAIVSAIMGRKDQQYDKIFDERFMELAPKSLGYDGTCPKELIPNVTKSIREFYLGDKKISPSKQWNLIDMYTDAWFFISSQISVKYYLEKVRAPVYYYYFAYRGTSSFTQLFGGTADNYGVCHADELQYLFPVGRFLFPGAVPSEEDYKVVDVMTSLWVNFAKSGNPTPKKTSLIPVKWETVRTPSLQYLHIGNSSNLRMDENLFPERIRFWNSLPYRGLIEVHDGECSEGK